MSDTLIKFDGKQCAATSCGTQSKHPGVHALLAAFAHEQTFPEFLKDTGSKVAQAGSQAIAAAEGFVKASGIQHS